jgi:elongation factor P
MDNDTYEQTELSKEQVSDVLGFLIENTQTTIAFNGEEPIEVRIPQHMSMKIAQTDPGEKGNTAQGGTKPATLETGVTIQVPLFVQEGEMVKVDTRDKRYIERVKS